MIGIYVRQNLTALSAAMFIFSTSDTMADCFKVKSMSKGEYNSIKHFPSESRNSLVREASTNDDCVIEKGFHPGGTECIRGQGTYHMTVRLNSTKKAYHIFKYKQPGQDYYCTTGA